MGVRFWKIRPTASRPETVRHNRPDVAVHSRYLNNMAQRAPAPLHSGGDF